MNFYTINPTTEEIIQEYREIPYEEIEINIKKAQNAYEYWRKTGLEERKHCMQQASKILLENKLKYANLMANEMGKPISQGIAEAEKCSWVCEYYAEKAEQFLKDEIIQTEAKKSFIAYQPIGVVLAIMPWNFPFWQVFRFAVPALMAGNAGILKHSRNTMGCGVEIEKLFLEAGFPEGLFKNLVIGSGIVEKIIEHPLIRAVTLTGSTPVGSKVARKAGSLIKKTVMELGGSDPYIILDDADLEKAVDTCVTARLINSGQSCISAKRFIVVKPLLKEFENLFVQKMKTKTMGNPLNYDIQIGPQAREDLRIDLHKQVIESIELGAELLLGGNLHNGKGYFYPPTVLTNVKKGMPCYSEETFGPVASIMMAQDENDAIRIANDTSFGLGSAIFTNDLLRGEKIAKEEIHAGTCFVNDYVKSDPRLPFGGINLSGYGRELSIYGIKEFVNIKTISIS